MKPSIERELEAIRQMVRDLEAKLKNERSELGHRVLFGVGRRGEVPAPTDADRAALKVLGVDGWVAQTGGGSGSGGLSTVYTDQLTVTGSGAALDPINANPLSGTIDARFRNLSGTIDGHFNNLSYLSAVSHDSSMTGDGTPGNPLSSYAAVTPLSGTINSAIVSLSGTVDAKFAAMLSCSQTWVHTANGTEGSTLTAVIPFPFAGPQYQVFLTNFTGTYSPAYKVQNKTSASFQIVSTAPFLSGDKLDILAVSGAFGPLADVNAMAALSSTIDAHFITLSGSINSRFSSIGGGYLGKGVGASTFAAGAFVKRGPFLFGTFSGSSVDPLIVEGNPGSSTDWKAVTQSGTPPVQSGSILTLNGGNTSTVNCAYRNSTNTGINNVRLICEAYISTGADAFSFGIVDSTQGFSVCPAGAIRGHTGSLGVEIDIWDNNGGTAAAPFQTGSAGPYIQLNTSGGSFGNQEIEATKYYRYYLDFKTNGANTHVTMSLYRDNYDTMNVDFPGYLAEWICALPTWASSPSTATWRVGVGGWSGGVSGIFKVRSFFVQRTVPEWDLVSILPHTPRIDWRIF